MRGRALIGVLAVVAALPAAAHASTIGMYSQSPRYVEVFYAADTDQTDSPNDVTVSASPDGSTVYLTDMATTIDPLPPQDGNNRQPCLVLDAHHAVCTFIGPPSPLPGYSVDHSVVHMSLGHSGPDRVRLEPGGALLEIDAGTFGDFDVDIPESVRSILTGGAGDMTIRIGRERDPGGFVFLGWGTNRLFAKNKQVDDIYCNGGSDRLVVDAIDNVDADCGA